jgi:hypothetical protein
MPGDTLLSQRLVGFLDHIPILQRESLAREKHVARLFAFVLLRGELTSQQGPNSLLSHVQQGRGPEAQGEGAQSGQGDGYNQGPG